MSEDVKAPDSTLSVDEFFKNQVYQQSIQASAGWTTVSQAIVAGVSKAIIDAKPGEETVNMEAIEKLMALTKTMQLDTIGIMKEMKNLDK